MPSFAGGMSSPPTAEAFAVILPSALAALRRVSVPPAVIATASGTIAETEADCTLTPTAAATVTLPSLVEAER